MPDPGLHQEAEEAAARIGILRHDGRYPNFLAGFKAAAESRDQRIKELMPYIQHGTACRARRVDYGDQHPCTCGLDPLLKAPTRG